MSSLIEVQNLRVRRGGLQALDIPSFELQNGDVLALVGPNGAGKSSLLLALAGLIPIERGEIRLAGRSLRQWGALQYRRRLALVFQEPLLLDLSVAGNVALGLHFRGVHVAEIRRRSSVWLKRLGIEALASRRAGELSGGEAQRVSLARALVLEPDLLLLDEPFSALDPPTRLRLLDDLTSLLAEDGRTAIFVTHDLQEAARMAHRIGVMIAGRLRQVGTARRIKAGPADEEVAAFVASL